MSGRFIAFFRGINVGKAKRISMSELRALFEALGFSDVQTVLNSGNVVFTAARTKPDPAKIEKALLERTGIGARVTLLSAAELAVIVTSNPLLEVATDPSRFLISVLRNADDAPKLEPILAKSWAPEAIAVAPRAAYLWCPDGILDSPLATAVGRLLGDGVTSRNWTTTMKLHEIAGGKSSRR